jgi:hypothetical protein
MPDSASQSPGRPKAQACPQRASMAYHRATITHYRAWITYYRATRAALAQSMPGASHLTRVITAAILAKHGLLDEKPIIKRIHGGSIRRSATRR